MKRFEIKFKLSVNININGVLYEVPIKDSFRIECENEERARDKAYEILRRAYVGIGEVLIEEV